MTGVQTCALPIWNLTGIPCCHAVACIFLCNFNAEEYVSDWYKRDTYLKAYTNSIPPCVGERHWTKVDYPLLPPPIKIGPGRPRKNRIKDPHEDPKKPGKLTKHGVEMHCSACKGKGHNKRRCPNKDSAATAADKRQRVDQASTSATPVSDIASEHASNVSAQPSRTGRNGRTIVGGRGSRGTRAGRGSRGA